MNWKKTPALAAVALSLGLAGTAHAAKTLTTSPVFIDYAGYDMFCDAVNASPTATVSVLTEFCNSSGAVQATKGPQTLAPGQGTSSLAPSGKDVFYCRVTVLSGSSKDVHAMAVITMNSRYLATVDAR